MSYLDIKRNSCTASSGTQSWLVILTANAGHDFLQPLTRQFVKDSIMAPIKRERKKKKFFNDMVKQNLHGTLKLKLCSVWHYDLDTLLSQSQVFHILWPADKVWEVGSFKWFYLEVKGNKRIRLSDNFQLLLYINSHG